MYLFVRVLSTCSKRMAVLLDNATNYVWQAFSALHQEKPGLVHKTKLKVLTANIGTLLDLYGIERGLEHYRSTNTLTFDQFKYYLQHEVFSSVSDKLPVAELRQYEERIAEVCWLVCRKKYTEREGKIFSEESTFQIFRIFCVLAELTQDANDGTYQVLLHPSEAAAIAETLAKSLGCTWDEDDFDHLSVCIGSFRFPAFITVLESRRLESVKDPAAIAEAVTDIYQTTVEDVLKKGFLCKRGYIFPTMREYWFVLRPSELNYFKTRSEKDRCGSIALDSSTRVETKAGFKVALHTPERTFELGTADHMSRMQWISALQLAIRHSGSYQSYQRLQAARRRLQRRDRVREMVAARVQLQNERMARMVAEGQARELEAVVKEESKKLNELEQIKMKLERLLEEETQAKRDEEIVRGLQARVLTEEWEKREELEKLQEEQKALLEEERGKRKEFEELQRAKEQQLRSAELRLEQLEMERKHLDEQLQVALDKIRLSEDKKGVLEARLYQVAPVLSNGEHVRRAHSFMPSTKERPVVLEVRSSTLKKSKPL